MINQEVLRKMETTTMPERERKRIGISRTLHTEMGLRGFERHFDILKARETLGNSEYLTGLYMYQSRE